MTSRHDRMNLDHRNGVTIMDLGEIEIWDGADLSLLRDTLTDLIEVQGCRSIGVNMTYVKYIPSGFFGMLYDWHEKGIAMRLYTPQRHVANMLWFRQFFYEESDGCHVLQSEPKQDLVAQAQFDWNNGADLHEDESQHSTIAETARTG